jgi:uncharacterized membrane protein YgdD (TMEM256/DUF423 family)
MLEDRLDLHQLEIYQKAVNYLTVHALALVIATLLPIEAKSKYVVGILFLSGIALFSGSLLIYSLSFLFINEGLKLFAKITPFGGTVLIIAWGYMTLKLIKK